MRIAHVAQINLTKFRRVGFRNVAELPIAVQPDWCIFCKQQSETVALVVYQQCDFYHKNIWQIDEGILSATN